MVSRRCDIRTRAQSHAVGGQSISLRIQVFAAAVDDVPSGLYEYLDEPHALTRLSTDDLRPAFAAATIGEQPWVSNASVLIVVLADMRRMTAHFHDQPPQGERGSRYAWIETGALVENIYLQAASLGLATVLVGGFDDARLQTALAEQSLQPTALMCIGKAVAIAP